MPPRPRPSPPRPSGGKARDRERAALAELIEVERAIAALEGRNVENAEHLVVLRRDAEERKAALERTLAAAREDLARRRKLLPLKVAAALVGLGALAAGGVWATRFTSAQLGERAAAIDAATQAAKPFLRDGAADPAGGSSPGGRATAFTLAKTAVGSETFGFAAAQGKCFVAAAAGTKGAARLRVERGTVTREAATSAGWCTCKDEEVRITASGDGLVATAVLEAPADAIGGADALAAATPRPAAVFAETVERACAEAAFDAWIAPPSAAPMKPDVERITHEEAAILSAGFAMVGFSAANAPFVLAPAATDTCLVAMSRRGALALRRKGGDRSLATKQGALGLCVKDSAGLSFWRDGDGEIALFLAPRARTGGLLGLRETAARAGVPIQLWTSPDDLGEDAHAALVASGIAVAPGGPAAERAAVYALSTDLRSTLTASSAGRDVACSPALDVGAIQTLCVEARPGAFDAAGAMPGVAKGPVPLWLAVPPSPDRAALDRGLDLLRFARRMSAEGFELTSLVGATLTAQGADVTGRSGEKQIVAIVVSSAKPWIHTLSNGAPWKLDAPAPIALAPGEIAKLTATPKYVGAAKREFVVWRR